MGLEKRVQHYLLHVNGINHQANVVANERCTNETRRVFNKGIEDAGRKTSLFGFELNTKFVYGDEGDFNAREKRAGKQGEQNDDRWVHG